MQSYILSWSRGWRHPLVSLGCELVVVARQDEVETQRNTPHAMMNTEIPVGMNGKGSYVLQRLSTPPGEVVVITLMAVVSCLRVSGYVAEKIIL